MDAFEIPVVLFVFKRIDTTLRIIERLEQIRPRRLYLISDGGRSVEEMNIVAQCRCSIEAAISWNCEVIPNFSEFNAGVLDRIGGGAGWVLSRERWAIFLEDDNLPELTFFKFCKEMLELYEHDSRVLWICGTNYLQKYRPEDGSSYVFTKHLMPCGWASWGHKFLKIYDARLDLLLVPGILNKLKWSYEDKRLFRQQLYNILGTREKVLKNPRIASWDYQMAFVIRINSMFGISPCYNQIENIGVDSDSTHGGNSYRKVMTRRFCSIKTKPLEFPLRHPRVVAPDPVYEKLVANYILLPLVNRFIVRCARIIKPLFGIGRYESFLGAIKKVFRKSI